MFMGAEMPRVRVSMAMTLLGQEAVAVTKAADLNRIKFNLISFLMCLGGT